MDSSMENNERQGAGQQPPHRGERQATVKESADLLKKLAEFSSKKEEVLKKIASISDRMGQRLGMPLTETGKSEDLMPEYLKLHRNNAATPGKFEKFVYTRVRETQKPIFADGCFNICMPSKAAFKDWNDLSNEVFGAKFSVQDDGLSISPGSSIKIPTGLKVALPAGIAFQFASMPGVSVDSPSIFTSHMHENELEITITNKTPHDVKVLFDTPLFTAFPIHLATNINCDELLNSTYEDWAHGTITG